MLTCDTGCCAPKPLFDPFLYQNGLLTLFVFLGAFVAVRTRWLLCYCSCQRAAITNGDALVLLCVNIFVGSDRKRWQHHVCAADADSRLQP